MNILILNWRDPKNPKSGGAEILTHELAKRWVVQNHHVTLFTSYFKNAKKTEIIDGVKIIRKGTWWTVHIYAFFYYIVYLKKEIDIIIDEVHFFPFFSGLYARKKTIVLVCEVANTLFFTLFPYTIALLGRTAEKIYLWMYKDIPTMVISQSTKKDLIKEGYKKDAIHVLPLGISYPNGLKIRDKENKPTIIYLGRINKQKGALDAIEAFYAIKKEIVNCQLWIVGSGVLDYITMLKKKIRDYKIASSITFFGFVSEERKFELLSKAHILIVPSVHEGWGLTVPEAGVTQTPAVVYNVAGLRDTVKQNVSGIIVSKTPDALARGVLSLVKDKKKYIAMKQAAQKLSMRYNWDNTAEAALKVLKH